MMSIPIRKAKLKITKVPNEKDLYYINFYSFMGISYLKIFFRMNKDKLKYNTVDSGYIDLPIKNMMIFTADGSTFILKEHEGTYVYILNTPYEITSVEVFNELENGELIPVDGIVGWPMLVEDPYINPVSKDRYRVYIWNIRYPKTVFSIKFKYKKQEFAMQYKYDGYLYSEKNNIYDISRGVGYLP